MKAYKSLDAYNYFEITWWKESEKFPGAQDHKLALLFRKLWWKDSPLPKTTTHFFLLCTKLSFTFFHIRYTLDTSRGMPKREDKICATRT
jgi:hypothetical protein